MCRRTTCSTCQKASWAGCGAHVDQVLAGISQEDRCSCADEGQAEPNWFMRMLGAR